MLQPANIISPVWMRALRSWEICVNSNLAFIGPTFAFSWLASLLAPALKGKVSCYEHRILYRFLPPVFFKLLGRMTIERSLKPSSETIHGSLFFVSSSFLFHNMCNEPSIPYGWRSIPGEYDVYFSSLRNVLDSIAFIWIYTSPDCLDCREKSDVNEANGVFHQPFELSTYFLCMWAFAK